MIDRFLGNVCPPLSLRPMIHVTTLLCLQTLLAPIAWTQNTPVTPPQNVVNDALLPTGQWIAPGGRSVSFHGRPVDVAFSADKRYVLAKDNRYLRVIDPKTMKLLQSLPSPGGTSLVGLVVDSAGNVYLSNSKDRVHVFHPTLDAAAPFELKMSIKLPPDSFPCGLAFSPDQSQLFVCLSKKNSLAVVDIKTAKIIKTIAVGVAPFDVCWVAGNPSHLLVTNIGGRRSKKGDLTAPSAGTPTVVDSRGIANTSAISKIDPVTWSVTSEFPAGLHPSSILWDQVSKTAIVTNTNEDSISVFDPSYRMRENIIVKPDPTLPFGSMPSAICQSVDGKTLFVALAGNNAIAVMRQKLQGTKSTWSIVGFIPTAWYPVAICCDEDSLVIANLKGTGSRSIRRSENKGRNTHDHLGLVQRVEMKEIDTASKLQDWTTQVRNKSWKIPQVRSSLRSKTGSTQPRPVPKKLGQPSVFKHVIYVIKENRTFDQVFGDVKEARSDANLCIFPERITPNHHALAKRFGLLDNYYCNGILSADGHSWATEGNVTPYLERAFGGFARSYTFGDDPITYSSSGFLWDPILAAGLSFRNYGEMNYSKTPGGVGYQKIWADYKAGKKIKFGHQIGIERVRRYSCPNYPGWNMSIPDVLRMDRFLAEFETFKKNGQLPNFIILYLPQDHLGGGVSSGAHMADNDLALGRLIQAVSHSKYWKDTLIVANEDDPQNGYDHIDGHRSLCLVVSAYSKGGVQHEFYNQSSVLRTILHIFGLPPLNQQVQAAPLMTGCFGDTVDLTPYDAIPANVSLNDSPLRKEKQTLIERKWRQILTTVPIERTGMKTTMDEDNLNRFVWHEMKGWDTPYPVNQSGGHGNGLKSIGLLLAPNTDKD